MGQTQGRGWALQNEDQGGRENGTRRGMLPRRWTLAWHFWNTLEGAFLLGSLNSAESSLPQTRSWLRGEESGGDGTQRAWAYLKEFRKCIWKNSFFSCSYSFHLEYIFYYRILRVLIKYFQLKAENNWTTLTHQMDKILICDAWCVSF